MSEANKVQLLIIWNYFSKLRSGQILTLITVVAFAIQSVYFVVIFTGPKSVHLIKRQEVQQNLKLKSLEYGGRTLQGSSIATQSRSTVRLRTCDKCFRNDFSLLYEPKEVCGREPVTLVVFITSLSSQRKHRDVIRQTWLSESRNNTAGVRYLFLLGRPVHYSCRKDIEAENEEQKDLVVYDFTDSYQNLSIKTILGFKYAAEHCPTAKFVMKADMDVYVNLKAILKLLTNNSKPRENAPRPQIDVKLKKGKQELKNDKDIGEFLMPGEMFGLLWKNSSPHRYNSSNNVLKWLVTYNEYPNNSYPDYFDGHAYILSMKITREVIRISRNIPFFNFEDVYIGLCLKELGYTLKATQGFLRLDQPLTLCSHKYEHVYTVHGVTSDRMTHIWNTTCPFKGNVEKEYIRHNNQWIKVYIDQKTIYSKGTQQLKRVKSRTKFYYVKAPTHEKDLLRLHRSQ